MQANGGIMKTSNVNLMSVQHRDIDLDYDASL
jgi:hypothetical protein